MKICDVCGSNNTVCDKKNKLIGAANQTWPYIWYCRDCFSYVGCHEGTHTPLGLMANKNTRYLRLKAHSVFDQIWRKGLMTRERAYRWLSQIMELEDLVHFSTLNDVQLRQAIALCNVFMEQKKLKVQQAIKQHHERKARGNRKNEVGRTLRYGKPRSRPID